MLGQSHLVTTDFLMLLRATHFDLPSMWGPVASLALGVVPLDAMDLSRAATSVTDGRVLAQLLLPLACTDILLLRH
tara:strand:- start:75 stop:302 length:228 start_codon:yes stop_codon:yes gene_type:complete